MSFKQTPSSQRARWILAAALVFLTGAVGAAARVAGDVAPSTVTAVLPQQFAAVASGPLSFSGNLDRQSVLHGTDGRLHIELLIGAEESPVDLERRLTDLIVVLDRSGSMSGLKLQYARAAVRELIGELGSADRFALVTYSDNARLDIELATATPGNRASWQRGLDAIHASGATNISDGLDMGFRLVEAPRAGARVPRIILISDGLANRGERSVASLVARARRAAQGEYALSTVGVGDDFNEQLMTAIADAGTGNYYYLQRADDLALVFAGEFAAARNTVASGLELRIDPGLGVQVLSVAGYPLEREGSRVVVRPGSMASGQQRRIWVTLAAPTERIGDYDLGRFGLAYTAGGERFEVKFGSNPVVACVGDREQFLSSVDLDRWERATTEESYGSLQQRVSDHVRRGRSDAAQHEIDQYISESRALNTELRRGMEGTGAVGAQIERAAEMKLELLEAFEAPNAQAARKRFSKEKDYAGQQMRKGGAVVAPDSKAVQR